MASPTSGLAAPHARPLPQYAPLVCRPLFIADKTPRAPARQHPRPSDHLPAQSACHLAQGRAAALKHNAACLEKRETIFDMPSHRLDCIVSEAGARAMPKDTKWRNWRYETVP